MSLIPLFLSMQSQLKTYHWLTDSFAQHKAFDNTYKALDGIIDKFMETCMGKHGKSNHSLDKGGAELKIFDCQEREPVEVVEKYVNIFENEFNNIYKNDSELLNIKDEIVGELQKLKYLLTLH